MLYLTCENYKGHNTSCKWSKSYLFRGYRLRCGEISFVTVSIFVSNVFSIFLVVPSFHSSSNKYLKCKVSRASHGGSDGCVVDIAGWSEWSSFCGKSALDPTQEVGSRKHGWSTLWIATHLFFLLQLQQYRKDNRPNKRKDKAWT